jgi:predicted secreted protein
MKNTIGSILILLLFGSLAAATGNPTAVVKEKLHKKFEIVLAANPTTGYVWQLDNKLNEKMIKLVGSHYSGPQSKLAGAGGEEIWTFQAVGRGRTRIGLKYVRPWEKNAKPARNCVYEIVIK